MTTKVMYIIGFIISSLLLTLSLYLQIYQSIEPCPLCVLQRIVFGLLACLFFIGIFLRAFPLRFIINSVLMLAVCLGIFLSGRQVWLQNFPSSGSSECGVSLQYMLQVLPLNEVAQKVFQGTAECSQGGWEFLKLNMAEWSLLWFFFFLALVLCLFFKEMTYIPKAFHF